MSKVTWSPQEDVTLSLCKFKTQTSTKKQCKRQQKTAHEGMQEKQQNKQQKYILNYDMGNRTRNRDWDGSKMNSL